MMKFKKALVTIISFLMCVTLFSIAAHAQGNEPDTSNTQDGTSDGVEINYVNFPDERFREYFVRNCDSDGDGKLSDEEISNVTVLNVFSGFSDYDKVGSIKGIEYFSSLEELTIYEDFQLTEIDFSQNKNLKSLSIYYCNNLYSIDISKNTELIGLGVYFCPKVKSIDLSNNTKLRSLNLQHTPIEVLDISNNTEFKDIIDVSNFSCTKYDHSYTYEYSDFDNHINKSLTVDLDTKLVYLKSEELGNVVTAIDESVFPDSLFREYVSKYDQNSDGKLSEKEINTISLLDFNGKQITSLKGIELLSSLKILKVAECQLSELNISNNEALEYLDCGGNSISELDLSNNKNLKTLICRDNGIKGLDLSKNDNLIVLICSGNPIKVADISKTNIKVLRCSNCELDELICRDGMYELDCSNNNLSEIKNLSFSNLNSESYYFYFEGYINEGTYGGGCALNCSNNEFSELNLSGITELYDFNCSNNKLMKIDVSNNTNLYRFDCSYNNLSQIDVSDNTNLYEFDCSHNNISKIEIVNSLGWVYCSNNQLKEFDASNITYGFNCSNNQIETLIIGSNGYYFKCYNNKLKTLDVSDNFAKDYCYSYTKDGVTFYTNSEYLNSDWTVDHFSVMSYLIVDESTNVFPIEKKYVIKLIPGSDELQGDGFTIYDSIEADGDYTLPDCEYTAPKGYEFDLWEVKVGSNEAVYCNSGEVISVSDHMNVTATWKKAPCYVFEDGVLTLRGEIVADEIKQFNQKNSVKSIKAEDGTVFPEDCGSLFVGYTACETIDFSNVDTSNVTDMSNMFSFLYIKKLDLSGFDMSSVTNAEKMFLGYPYSVPDEITLGEKFTKIDSSMSLMNGYLGWTCGSTDSEKVSGDEWHPAVISNTGKNTYYKKRAKWDDLDYEFSIVERAIPDTSIGNIGLLEVVHSPEDLYNESHLSCEWRRDGELINQENFTTYVIRKEDIGHTITCKVFDQTYETSGYKNAEFDGSGKVGKAVFNFTSEELEAKWETEPCSENGAADGKIYNLTENVEYATKADFSDSKKCSDAKPEDWVTTDKGIALTGFAAGTYYLRYFETDTCEASETAVVVVEEPKKEVTWGDTEIIIFKYVLYQPYQNIEVPRYGDTLYAYIATSDGSYTIPGLSEQYQWMRGDEIIEGATNNMYKVQKEDIGYIISCVVSDESGTITGSISGKTKAKADKAYFGSKAEELARAWKTEPCTKKGSSDGRIYNLAATIEIATNPDFKDSFFAGDIGKEYYVVTDEGMALEYFKAGTYYLRVPEDDTQYASETVTLVILDGPADDLTGTVSINGTTKYGQTLIAKVTDSNANEFNYQWKRGDDDINGATASTYTLAKEDIGKIVSCVVTDKSEYTEGNISGKTSVKIEKADGPAAPAGVKGIACSENGSSDGQITGTDSSMEYATIADFSDKKKCDGTVTGLAAGTYYVRIAETDTAKAGADIEIVVEDGPEVQKTQEELVSDFVKRFYTIILEREEVSDEEIDYYTTRLMSHEIDGCSVARGFVMSPEYINKFEDDSTFVNKMYAAFFNREADAAQYYCDILAMGYSREVVLAGFVNSPEFKNLCAEYGIEPGELIIDSENNNQGNNQGSNEENNQGNNEENNQGNNEENNQGNNEDNNQGNNPSDDITKLNLDSTNVNPEKLDNYVQNLYLQILGRGFDEGGLEYWKENIMSGEVYDAATAARVGFFESPEYQEKNKTNEEFVIDCYHAFLGRDPEPEGLAYWTEKLDSGEYSKQKVIDLGFGHSDEFKNILRDCGFGIIE